MDKLSRRDLLTGLSAMVLLAPFGAALAAKVPPVGAPQRVALRGYDPVAYFTAGHPEKGSAQFSASFDGATYWFKNDQNRARFVGDPERYAPQYNGYCAINVSRGRKVEPDPEAWVIWNDKLYVFQAKKGIAMFRRHRATIVAKAEANWPALRRPH